MTRKKKSGFITFCLSFLPGAGEMYLGFMKMGVSMMGLFALIVILGDMLQIGAFGYIGIVAWFYSFFHVHNLAGLTDNELMNTEDEFLFDLDKFFDLDKKNINKYRKVIAIVLIIMGIILLWNGITAAIWPMLPESILRIISRLENTLPRIIVGIAIIVGGFHMIKGKKEETEDAVICGIADSPAKEDISTGEERSIYGTEADEQNS